MSTITMSYSNPINLDLTKLELIDALDEKELEFHSDLTSGKTKSIDSPEVRKYYAKIFKNSNSRDRNSTR